MANIKNTFCVVKGFDNIAVWEARGVFGKLLGQFLPIAKFPRVFKLCLCLIDLVSHLLIFSMRQDFDGEEEMEDERKNKKERMEAVSQSRNFHIPTNIGGLFFSIVKPFFSHINLIKILREIKRRGVDTHTKQRRRYKKGHLVLVHCSLKTGFFFPLGLFVACPFDAFFFPEHFFFCDLVTACECCKVKNKTESGMGKDDKDKEEKKATKDRACKQFKEHGADQRYKSAFCTDPRFVCAKCGRCGQRPEQLCRPEPIASAHPQATPPTLSPPS